ncbi:FtsB family cell division protein [Actinobaculum suis]|uniref:FtsB family cell division protein n=1 Tax=Actinobaculum suis TaxID=1657 RepID=UPI00163BEE50|nr:septum formation initiator family protein [Actinobaculum suis]
MSSRRPPIPPARRGRPRGESGDAENRRSLRGFFRGGNKRTEKTSNSREQRPLAAPVAPSPLASGTPNRLGTSQTAPSPTGSSPAASAPPGAAPQRAGQGRRRRTVARQVRNRKAEAQATLGGRTQTGKRAERRSETRGARPGKARRGQSTARTGRGSPKKPQGKRGLTFESGNGPRTISLRLIAVFLFAVLALIIITPTFTRYLGQQEQLRQVRAEYEDLQQRSADLEAQLAQWQDDDYVRQQARLRLGYVVPGERLYVTPGFSEATAQERQEEKVAEANRTRRSKTPWYITWWESTQIAGYASDGEVDNPNDTPLLEPAPAAETSAPEGEGEAGAENGAEPAGAGEAGAEGEPAPAGEDAAAEPPAPEG